MGSGMARAEMKWPPLAGEERAGACTTRSDGVYNKRGQVLASGDVAGTASKLSGRPAGWAGRPAPWNQNGASIGPRQKQAVAGGGCMCRVHHCCTLGRRSAVVTRTARMARGAQGRTAACKAAAADALHRRSVGAPLAVGRHRRAHPLGNALHDDARARQHGVAVLQLPHLQGRALRRHLLGRQPIVGHQHVIGGHLRGVKVGR